VAIIAIGFLYRLIFVYRWRAGDCTTGPQPAGIPTRYPKRLVVMTYNIEGDAELLKNDQMEEIAKVINEVRPDVACLNEVHQNTWQSRFRDQPSRLGALTHMNVVFGRSYGEIGGGFGNAILTRGKIVHHEVHNLPAAGEPRSLLEAVIAIDGVPVEVFVTHVAAWGKLNSGIRSRQLACAANHVRTSAWPHILAGDLNAPPQSSEMEEFRRINTTLQICGETIDDTQKIMKQRIDYIFADRLDGYRQRRFETRTANERGGKR
jgi:endonuclease/exonuclease/phosphatase family metal-dependent hydrolase